jgi:hypothetical protein
MGRSSGRWCAEPPEGFTRSGLSRSTRPGGSPAWGARIRTLIAGTAVALALGAAPAGAVAPGAGWGPGTRLASGVDSVSPALAAMSLRDDAVVGWTRRAPARAFVRLRRGARGAWAPPIQLGPGTLTALAMDRAGAVLAIRQVGPGPPRAARIAPDGTVVSSTLGAAGAATQVLDAALRDDGRAVALVLRPDGETVRLLVQATPTGTWAASGPDLPLPDPGAPGGVEFSGDLNRDGRAVVGAVEAGHLSVGVSTRFTLTGDWTTSSSKPFDPPFLEPLRVVRPVAAIGDDGSSAVTWTRLAPFPDPSRGAGLFVTRNPGSLVGPLPVFGPTVAVAVSPSGTAMMAWADPVLGGNLFASRFARVGSSWPIGIRLLADAATLDEGVFALAAVTSRLGPVLVEASLETGPGPDGHVAFARDPRGAQWGALRRLPSSRSVPAVVAGERAGLIALAIDDTDDLVVTPYDRLPRVTKLSVRRVAGRLVARFTLSRPATLTGTVRSLDTGAVASIAPRAVGEGARTVTLGPAAAGRYRLRLVLCSRGVGCAPARRIVTV